MPASVPQDANVTTADCTLPDGRSLAYAIAGDPAGTPVVAHHGTPGSRLFAGLLADAAREAGVRLLVPDRPGYGYSTPPPEGWGWTDWPADFEALLNAESIDRAGVLGFSGGGPFTIAAAASDRAVRVGLVSALTPPAEGELATLARVPLALRALFRLSGGLARLVGPEIIVEQYTDRDVSEAVAEQVAVDFREALRQGARASARESRWAARRTLDSAGLDAPIRAWHGIEDTNTALAPLCALVMDVGGEVRTDDGDHLGTLLNRRWEALEWFAESGS